jgi:hypothetical protein
MGQMTGKVTDLIKDFRVIVNPRKSVPKWYSGARRLID